MNENATFKQLEKYADLYVKHKKELFPLIRQYAGKYFNEPFPADATHGEMATIYVELLKVDPEFEQEVNGMLKKYHNAFDPITAIANVINQGLGLAGTAQQRKLAQEQQDAALYQMVLERQRGDSTKTILIISGLAIVVIGGIIFLMIKRK
jgi:hypothetical protein